MCRRPITIALILAGLIASLGGPSGCTLRRQVVIEGPAAGEGPLAADVSNFRGGVRLIVVEGLDEPMVRMTVRPGTPPPGGEDDPDAQDLSWARAEMVEQEGGRVLRVVAEVPEGWSGEGASASLEMHLPRCDGVRIHTSEGAVRVIGVAGAIEIVNGVGGMPGGDVTIRTSDILSEPVTVRTTSGDIELRIAEGSGGALDLATDDGTISVRARSNLDDFRASPTEWRGALNEGEAPIVLRTGSGDIRVREGSFPFAFVPRP